MKKYKYKTVYGNLFTEIEQFSDNYNVVVPHVCNNHGVFGGGFTAGIVKHYPVVQQNYELLGKKCVLGYTQFIVAKHNKNNDKKIIFCNMIAQNGTISKNNPKPINYYALCLCMKSVSDYISTSLDILETQIHAPKFGSGLAGGNWNLISELIEDIWSNYPTFIYALKNDSRHKQIF
jgi:hypothetical protein